MREYENAVIGENTIIEENVLIGMQYHPACGKAIIGPNSILRAGTIIYGDVKIGAYFQSGHHTVIRGRVEMGDYCTVTNGAVIEGMVKMGDAVRLMSHVYVASRTRFGNRVVCGPNVVFLNEKRPGPIGRAAQRRFCRGRCDDRRRISDSARRPNRRTELCCGRGSGDKGCAATVFGYGLPCPLRTTAGSTGCGVPSGDGIPKNGFVASPRRQSVLSGLAGGLRSPPVPEAL